MCMVLNEICCAMYDLFKKKTDYDSFLKYILFVTPVC